MSKPDAMPIFLEAVENHRPEAWRAFLDSACGTDTELRSEIEKLLEGHRALGTFHEDVQDLAAAGQATILYPGPSLLGTQIGPYKLREQIGEGGMGVVYVAEQTEPVKRKVALKIIKPGIASKDVLARFEAERQALAMMDHPNIAKVFDAGSLGSPLAPAGRGVGAEGLRVEETAAGDQSSAFRLPPSAFPDQPYFVMELVYGIPITSYCDEHRLTTDQRLRLFAKVCRAIQHAHQKGVIHRDLKPSNVLVATIDGEAVPKVIDFGVAKAAGTKLTDTTVYTQFSQLIGTPLYMSPEQAELGVADVDTRSDVYSLGVLLYELLTGSTPFDSETLKSAGFDEMRRIIREDEPPKPSAMVSTLKAEALSTISQRRGSDPRKLSDSLSGELDWLVMKALEKDRNRRYESASSLARDVERYLQDEPIEACPPSRTYRIQKYVRRNSTALITATIVLAGLVVGTAFSVWQATLARRAEALAETRLRGEMLAREEAQTAERRASAEAVRSKQVARFLKEMLAAAGPSVARGRDATVLREILQNTVARVESDLRDQPEVQGDLWFTVGSTYRDIFDYQTSIPMLEKAASCFEREPGGANLKLARVLGLLGSLQSFQGDVETGKSNAQRGLDMARLLGDPATLANCLYYRGRATIDLGQGSAEAAPYLRQAISIWQELGDEPAQLAKAMSSLSHCDVPPEEGKQLALQSLEIVENLFGTNHPLYLNSLLALGLRLTELGEFDRAVEVLEQTNEKWQVVYADKNHFTDYVVKKHLAIAIEMQGDRKLARSLFVDTLSEDERHQYYRIYCKNLFNYLVRQNRIEEARAIFQEVEMQRTELDDDDPEAAGYEWTLGVMRRRFDEAGVTEAEKLQSRLDEHSLIPEPLETDH